jgi:hypothetical protein
VARQAAAEERRRDRRDKTCVDLFSVPVRKDDASGVGLSASPLCPPRKNSLLEIRECRWLAMLVEDICA